MSLTPEDVNRIALLARLDLSSDERGAMRRQLNDFFGTINSPNLDFSAGFFTSSPTIPHIAASFQKNSR